MTFFYSFTDSLKNKWLQFFQTNRDWIKLHMEVESVYTPDGGKRPPSYLILGVVNALEPKLAQLMLPFSKLNTDADILVEVLGLHFDPDVALGNCLKPKSTVVEAADNQNSAYVTDAVSHEEAVNDTVAETDAGFSVSEDAGFSVSEVDMQDAMSSEVDMQDAMSMSSEMDMQDAMSSEVDMQDAMSTDDSEVFQVSEEPQNGTANFSETTFEESQVEAGDDAFGDISFDDLKDSQSAGETEVNMDEQMFDDIGASATDDAFSDVMKDVWSEETASHHGEANNQSGEEMSTDAIDNPEMAEIFSHS